MNNNVLLPIVSWSDTQVVTTVPSTAAQGSIFLQVQSHGVLRNAKSFTVTGPLAINSISYDPVAPGAMDCIHGSGFGATQGSSQLLINGAAVNIPWSDTQLCPTIASTTPLGTATAQVVTATGSSNVLSFTVGRGRASAPSVRVRAWPGRR